MIESAPALSDEAHDQFLALLPTIRRQAALAFRSQPPGTRDDLIQEAGGETTKATARKSNVSPGRVSQVRRELQEAWERFQAGSVA